MALELGEVHARQGLGPPMGMQSPSPSSADDGALSSRRDVAKQPKHFHTPRWQLWNRKFRHSIASSWNIVRAAQLTGHCLTKSRVIPLCTWH